MGLAAIRDVATFLRHDASDRNPLAANGRSTIDRAVGFGISQSGRVLRDLLYLGLNEDERGRIVFDGMMPHIAGSRRSFTNARFAQPGRNPGPHLDRYYPADQFPFAYETTTDALTGRRDGLLLRCRSSNTCPLLMHVDSEYELWGSRGALVTTDTRGADLPSRRRSGSTWSPGRRTSPIRTPGPRACPVAPCRRARSMPGRRRGRSSSRSRDGSPIASRRRRAAIPRGPTARWDKPAHLYPPIPGLPYAGLYNPAQWVEPGDPPVVRGTYPLLLPKVDPDGNTLAGIRLPLIEAPRATYTAWNPTRGVAADTLCNQKGGVLPFAATKAERRPPAIRGPPSRSATRIRTPTRPPSRRRPSGWWPSAPCCRRMPRRWPRRRRKAGWRGKRSALGPASRFAGSRSTPSLRIRHGRQARRTRPGGRGTGPARRPGLSVGVRRRRAALDGYPALRRRRAWQRRARSPDRGCPRRGADRRGEPRRGQTRRGGRDARAGAPREGDQRPRMDGAQPRHRQPRRGRARLRRGRRRLRDAG